MDRVRVRTEPDAMLPLLSSSGRRLAESLVPLGPLTGEVVAVSHDQLVLDLSGRYDHVIVPFERVVTLERSTGADPRHLKRVAIGLALGIAAGALIGSTLGGNGCLGERSGATCAKEGAIVLGATGALIGGISAPLTYRWEPVPLERGPQVSLNFCVRF